MTDRYQVVITQRDGSGTSFATVEDLDDPQRRVCQVWESEGAYIKKARLIASVLNSRDRARRRTVASVGRDHLPQRSKGGHNEP